MFSGHGLEVGSGGIGPGQELVDAAVGVAVDDAGDDVGEVGVRLDADELAGLDQRGDDRPVLGAAVGAGEERILAVEGERADRCARRRWCRSRCGRRRGSGSGPAQRESA